MAPPDTAQPTATIDALATLRNLVASDMAEVNRLIVEYMQSPVSLIPELASYIVASGGKRLRPLLTLGAARMCGYEGEYHQHLAAAVEFIHTATLLHDDVVDESDLRRGNATANAVWGNQASVLVGDFLFSRSFQLMVTTGSMDVLKILADASATIAAGEVLQLTTAGEPSTEVSAYMDVIKGKTAALFAAAAEVGGVIADASTAEADALRTYGTELGIAFQLVDDRLDYDADQATLGKSVGDDFREGKVTLPIIIAYQNGSPDEKAFWQRTIGDGDGCDTALAEAQRLLAKHDALAETGRVAAKHARAAAAALSVFPANKHRAALREIAAYCAARAF
ncbi:MAG: polyprenyl synthetase family protein [Alphaproteobacteria bacterium]